LDFAHPSRMRRHRPARDRVGPRRLPAEARQSLGNRRCLRTIDQSEMGGVDSFHPASSLPRKLVPPSGGRGGPFPRGAAPPPGRWPGWIFTNSDVGHTRKASNRDAWCRGKLVFIHERGPLTDLARFSIENPRGGRYSWGPERRETRSAPDRWIIELVVSSSSRAISCKGHGLGRGRVGVVKLLRARGGCLGVIRWWAWEAAKGPGELPNERRSRNAR
jgi:hypothetical protein